MNTRIAILGFSIECNRFAPPATEADFAGRTLLRGESMIAEARAASPRMLAELPGFIHEMDRTGPWQAVPLVLAMAEPNGPVDHAFFASLMREWREMLQAAPPVGGVYCVLHGAGLTTEDDDPEGTLLTMIREIVGPRVPVVATFDLHANVSAAMTDELDAFIGYRTNPHLDMRERGAEAAQVMRKLLRGLKTAVKSQRLPIVPPSVTMLTGADVPDRPYGELIDFGQSLIRGDKYAGRVINVSVMGGFAFSDTSYNGLTAVVTATDTATAAEVCREVAKAGWTKRNRFVPRLTSLSEATRRALATRENGRPALIFADVADNPGGGGRGNTMYILESFHEAGVTQALVGIIHDPALAEEAHAAGTASRFKARFNRDVVSEFSKPFTADAKVVALHRGQIACRRGIFAGGTVDLGPSAALDLNGITVVVVSRRVQCADPAFFESFGLDIARARVVVVKSRGHFRGGFDEFFSHAQVVEVDAPGLTSPILSNFAWKHLPRPVLPLDPDAVWSPEGEVAVLDTARPGAIA